MCLKKLWCYVKCQTQLYYSSLLLCDYRFLKEFLL